MDEQVATGDTGAGKSVESASVRQWARVFQRRCKPGDTTGVGNEVASILKFLDGGKSGAGASNTGDIAFALANVLTYYAPATAENLAPIDKTSSQGTGVVTKWFATRGFGFIKTDADSSEDLFAHMTEIEGKFNALVIGKSVSFTRAFNAKRGNFQATKVSGEACVRAKMNGRSRGICFDFQKGTCTRGAACRFSHTRGRSRGRGRGRRGGRGRGYNSRGRGGYNVPSYPYGYGAAAMYMPYGGGYGMVAYGGYEGMYGAYPMPGYSGAGYGGYTPFPSSGSFTPSNSYSPMSPTSPVYNAATDDAALASPTADTGNADAPAPSTAGGDGGQNPHSPQQHNSGEGGYSFSNVASSF